jgi:hypothetical protein
MKSLSVFPVSLWNAHLIIVKISELASRLKEFLAFGPHGLSILNGVEGVGTEALRYVFVGVFVIAT